MRPLPLWLPSLLLCGLGAAASSPDSFSQLAAPLNPRLHLYNDEQILTWEPSPSSNDPRPVVYQVEYSFIDGSWHRLLEPNCTDITETKCDLTGGGRLKLFPHPFTVFLRVRAKRGNLTSKWVGLEPFQHYENVTVGPPKNISVTPGKGSLVIHFSPPFDVFHGATFQYQSRVKYWFQAPPNIPEQIEEYLKDPDQFILEVLDKDGSPKEDSWDSVYVLQTP